MFSETRYAMNGPYRPDQFEVPERLQSSRCVGMWQTLCDGTTSAGLTGPPGMAVAKKYRKVPQKAPSDRVVMYRRRSPTAISGNRQNARNAQ